MRSYLKQTLTEQFGGLKPMLDGCLRNKEKWQEQPSQSLHLGAIFCFTLPHSIEIFSVLL